MQLLSGTILRNDIRWMDVCGPTFIVKQLLKPMFLNSRKWFGCSATDFLFALMLGMHYSMSRNKMPQLSANPSAS